MMKYSELEKENDSLKERIEELEKIQERLLDALEAGESIDDLMWYLEEEQER